MPPHPILKINHNLCLEPHRTVRVLIHMKHLVMTLILEWRCSFFKDKYFVLPPYIMTSVI